MKSNRSKYTTKKDSKIVAIRYTEMVDKQIKKFINWKYTNILIVIILLTLSLGSIQPLFLSGFFPFHDATQVARVSEMKDALLDGMLPVRWSENLGYGYGYPIFNFYAPLIYYIGGILNVIGFTTLAATKVMIGMGMLIAGVSMYFFAKQFWGRIGGIISAMLYVYAPYHAVNLYVRGALSELWAYGIIPFVFLGIYNIFRALHDEQQKKRVYYWFYFTAIAYALVIISHNLTAMMLIPFIFVFTSILFLFVTSRKKEWKNLLLFISLLFGMLLSASYWLPALAEMHYTNVTSLIGGGSRYADHFICLQQLWYSPWGFAGSSPGCTDGVSFAIGKIHIFLALLSIVLLFIPKVSRKQKITVVLAIVGTLSSLFFMLEYSKAIWNLIPQMAFLQFPWRFLVLVNFFIAFLGGAAIVFFSRRIKVIICLIIIVCILCINIDKFVPSKSIQTSSEELTNRSTISWNISKISDEYMPLSFAKPKNSQEIPKKKIILNDPSAKAIIKAQKTGYIDTEITTPQITIANIAIAYFPSWQIFIDKKQTPYTQFEQGIRVKIPKGNHRLEAVFIETPIEMIGNALTLTGVMVIIAGIIAQRKDKKHSAETT